METQKKVKAVALMTAGRYEHTWCRNQIDYAFSECGIPMTVSGGVFYGQCMQNMLQAAIKSGAEYAITVDGDSVFTGAQVIQLLSVAVQESDTIDALCAMQIRRGMTTMLGTITGQNSCTWNGYPVKLDTAHFGLTVINLAKLASTPKPWFFCQPNEDGEWGENRIDSDIWFWCQWQKAGNSVYIDPSIKIGHVEEVVAIHDDNHKHSHVYPADWTKFCADQAAKAVEAIPAGSVS